MNAVLDLLSRRRSVNPLAMTGPGPDPDQLSTLLTLGARVPDHGKLTPWRFIVFEQEGRALAGGVIAEIFAQDHPGAEAAQLEFERGRLSRAPLVVGVVSRAAPHVKIPEWEQILSAGAAAMALTIAANAMGFVTDWKTEWYAYDRRVLRRFGLAEHEQMAGFVHIGRAREAPEDRSRPDLAQIVTRFA